MYLVLESARLYFSRVNRMLLHVSIEFPNSSPLVFDIEYTDRHPSYFHELSYVHPVGFI
jgi:hypothetical protein